jgi:hypothetical protein
MNGVVQSWTDTSIVAQVAAGSTSGNVQVLQNGVLSNPVPFTVPLPHITSISPTAGVPGTQVTIAGSGFGTIQGMGTVWLGSTGAQVVSWTDTQILAAAAPNTVTGMARVQQYAVWSNTLPF